MILGLIVMYVFCGCGMAVPIYCNGIESGMTKIKSFLGAFIAAIVWPSTLMTLLVLNLLDR